MLCFPGKGDQKKFTKNPRPFSMQNSQATMKKLFTKCFWRAGKVTKILENTYFGTSGLKNRGAPKTEIQPQQIQPPFFSRTLKSTLIIGVPKSEFSGSQKGGGEEGNGVGEGTGPEGQRCGK